MANFRRSPFMLIRLPSIQLEDLYQLSTSVEVIDDTSYQKAFYETRKQIQKLAQNEDLLNGLLFSSHSFLESLHKYFEKDPRTFNKKLQQIERRALSYLQRMTINASPLSSFAKVQLRDEAWNYLSPLNPSMVLPNAEVISKFEQEIYKENLLSETLELRINPFLQRSTDMFSLLQFNGTIGIELVRLEISEQLDGLYEEIKFKKCSLIDVQNTLESILGTGSDEALSIVLDLLRLQFLVPVWQEADVPKDEALVTEQLEQDTFTHKMTSKFLNASKEPGTKFYFNNIKDTEAVKSTQRFYEHCFDRSEISKPSFDIQSIEAEVIQLYDFVQSCVKELNNNYGGLTLLEAFETWQAKIRVRLDKTKLLKNDSSYEIELDHVPKSSKPEQLGIMLRPIPNSNKNLLLSWTTAYGKYIRRYLPNYSKDELGDTFAWIGDSKSTLVQNVDKSQHPSNTIYRDLPQIDFFNFQSDVNNNKKIKVQLDIRGHLVDIRNGDPIEIVDLSIQNPASRSAFYNFMNQFSPYRNYLQFFIEELFEVLREEKDDFVYYPRLETPLLILRLEAWEFKDKEVLIGKNLSGFQQYEHIQKLRNTLKCSRLVSVEFENKHQGYLDFDNVISVDIFTRKIRKTDEKITLRNQLLNKDAPLTPNTFAEYYWEFKTDYNI